MTHRPVSEHLDPCAGRLGASVRDRDYLLDRHGIFFKVIGDVHPNSHYVGHVKYYPHPAGDRRLCGRPYRQTTDVSKSFSILADRPECHVYSSALGRVVTGVPREDVAVHYSARSALLAAAADRERVAKARAGADLLAVVDRLIVDGDAEVFGVTGSFMLGCVREYSDIDLVCYGFAGYKAARQLFADPRLIRPYGGDDLVQLYRRRAEQLPGIEPATLVKREQRKLQGLGVRSGMHINCEPIRADDDDSLAHMGAKEIGEARVLATMTDHDSALMTPALYRIAVQRVVDSTVDEPESFTRRIGYLRSYLGAYTGTFRTGDTVIASGKLIHLTDGTDSGFGIELTPWSVNSAYVANFTTS